MKNAEDILKKLNSQPRVNYDKVFQKLRQSWQKRNQRPKILLHSCCAPCSTYSLECLTESADVTIYFLNPNIHPQSEYKRRQSAQEQFIHKFNQRTRKQVQLIAAAYQPNQFIQMVKKLYLEDEPEGGKRCYFCFQMRLDGVGEKAKELSYDYFGSTLTISPRKNSQTINEIGLDVQKIYDVNYLPSDFKKNNGYQRSIEMCKEYDIYRQSYCGCVFCARDKLTGS